MKVKYASERVEQQCKSMKAATKLFGGNKSLALSLHSRINAMENAETIRDIIVMPQFHFHNLHGDMEGLFAIDVKSRRDKWRVVICPLDDKEEKFMPCHIDEVSGTVKIVEIEEVSPHYE